MNWIWWLLAFLFIGLSMGTSAFLNRECVGKGGVRMPSAGFGESVCIDRKKLGVIE